MTDRKAPGVLCLRPFDDFERVGVPLPPSLRVDCRPADDPAVASLLARSSALLIPAVGPKLPVDWFRGSTLRLVQVMGTGVDRVDAVALSSLGIPVCNVAGASNAAVAEYVATAASFLLRRLMIADAAVKGGHYAAVRKRFIDEAVGGVEDALVGIVGFGAIGQSVARALRHFGCRICFYDPHFSNAQAAVVEDAQPVSLEALLATADVVSVHVPLAEETRGLIGARQLASMKPGAVLIQASRGGVVDERALADALRDGRIAGAAVDVFEVEPPPATSPLLALDAEAAGRLLLTPHIAGVTRQSWTGIFRASILNLERVLLQGEAPHAQVN